MLTIQTTDLDKRAARRRLAAKAPDLELAHARFWGREGRGQAESERAPQLERRELHAVAVRVGPDSIAFGVLHIVEIRRAA